MVPLPSLPHSQVSQVYISWPPGTVGAPQLQLVAVNRTTLANGYYKDVSASLLW